MRFASSVVEEASAERAVQAILAPIDATLTPGMVDLALLFVTGHFEKELPSILDRVTSAFSTAVLIGCTAEGTIGVQKELERVPSMSLLVASLPDVRIRPFHIRQNAVEHAQTAADWERIVGASPESRPVFIVLADPFSLDVHGFIDRINQVYPRAPLVGGVASAARQPRGNGLFLNGEVLREGAVGVALSGRLTVDTAVSQGCRPIGRSFVITKAERNVIRELGGKPALEQLQEVLTKLTPEDDRLARQSLLIGRAIDEYKGAFGRGDFLIHGIVGADRSSGSIGIAGLAKTGATVQFHVRDADSADEDLRAMLKPHAGTDVRGAMLFGCNGRGMHMWPTAGHDAGVVRELIGDVPLGGFFCGGEFGPVGGRNFVHGFTASIALFREPRGPQTGNDQSSEG